MAQINKATDYFNTVLWTGDDTTPTRTITGVGFQPDLVWAKRRSNTGSNYIWDVARGTNLNIFSNHALAELNINTGDPNGGVSTSSSDGFTVIEGTSDINALNQGGETHVAWNWLAGGTASSNTDGSITSSVSANTTAGFSVVTWTSNGSANQTIGHGLGVAPAMYIIKNRSTVTDWGVYHQSLGATKWIRFNSNDVAYTASDYWNNTAPTSTVFTVGANNTNVNDTSGNSYVAYCFAEKKGFSKFGSFTGNGSTDGTFVYTGFKPSFLMWKSSSASSGNWAIIDNKRAGYNADNDQLYANLNNAENNGSSFPVDILSNGFKNRYSSANTTNASGVTYIYMAFAENPLVGTNNIPATAR